MVKDVLSQVQHQQRERQKDLKNEQKLLDREMTRWQSEIKNLVGQIKHGERNSAAALRLVELENRVELETARLASIKGELTQLEQQAINDEAITETLAEFDTLWQAMAPHEQARLVGLLIERVDYDGGQGQVSITFHPTGLQTMLGDLAKEKCA